MALIVENLTRRELPFSALESDIVLPAFFDTFVILITATIALTALFGCYPMSPVVSNQVALYTGCGALTYFVLDVVSCAIRYCKAQPQTPMPKAQMPTSGVSASAIRTPTTQSPPVDTQDPEEVKYMRFDELIKRHHRPQPNYRYLPDWVMYPKNFRMPANLPGDPPPR